MTLRGCRWGTRSRGDAYRTGLLAFMYIINMFLLPLISGLLLDPRAWYVSFTLHPIKVQNESLVLAFMYVINLILLPLSAALEPRRLLHCVHCVRSKFK